MNLNLTIFPTIFLISIVVGCSHSFNNPVDPANASSSTASSGTSTSSSTSGAAGTSTSGATTSASGAKTSQTTSTQTASPTATPTPWTITSADFFGVSDSTSQIGTDPTILVSKQLNQITVLYRANYASSGIWQLYVKRFSVGSDGTLSLLDSTPVNLYPNCFGNSTGVTSFVVSGYLSGLSAPATGAFKATDYNDAMQNLTGFKVTVTCVNSAQSGSATYNLSSGITSTGTTTTPLLVGLGALGYWSGKNVYVKGDGTTLNPNGTASSVTAPVMTAFYGDDGTGIYYEPISGCNNGNCYISNSGGTAVSTNFSPVTSILRPFLGTSMGLVFFEQINENYFVSTFLNNESVVAADISYDVIHFSGGLGAIGRGTKLVFSSSVGPYVGSGEGVYTYNFENGTTTQVVPSVDIGAGIGWYGQKSVFLYTLNGNGSSTSAGKIYLTPNYFDP